MRVYYDSKHIVIQTYYGQHPELQQTPESSIGYIDIIDDRVSIQVGNSYVENGSIIQGLPPE